MEILTPIKEEKEQKLSKISKILVEWDNVPSHEDKIEDEDDLPYITIVKQINGKETKRATLNWGNTNISCGVKQISNLYDLNDKFTTEEIRNIIKDVVTLCKDGVPNLYLGACAYVLFSNNLTSALKVNKVLDELAIIKTEPKANPNSGNRIKVWIL